MPLEPKEMEFLNQVKNDETCFKSSVMFSQIQMNKFKIRLSHQIKRSFARALKTIVPVRDDYRAHDVVLLLLRPLKFWKA
jgi:hypothetical protein